MNRLSKYITTQFDEKGYDIEKVKNLYAITAYDGLECNEIIESDSLLKLKQAACYYGKHPEIIGEKLDKNAELIMDHALYCPIAAILDMESIKIKEVYPFDPEEVKLPIEASKFRLDGDAGLIRKYIQIFFGSNDNYMRQTGVRIIESQNITANILSQLLCTKTMNPKKYTVTILIDKEVSLLGHLKCLVLPEKLLAYESFLRLTTKTDLVIKPYTTEPNIHPAYYNTVVNSKIREFYSENGLL